jgi:hypothetical protein
MNADVAPTGDSIRFAVPPSPPIAQPKAGDTSHEVELGRIRQAKPDRAEGKAIGANVDVVLVEDLRDRVVLADVQPNVVDLKALHVDEPVAWSRGRGRHSALEHEHASSVR